MLAHLSESAKAFSKGLLDFFLRLIGKLRSNAVTHQTKSSFKEFDRGVDSLPHGQLTSPSNFVDVNRVGQMWNAVLHVANVSWFGGFRKRLSRYHGLASQTLLSDRCHPQLPLFP